MTKQIFLTQNKIALVDDDDFDYLNQWKWCALHMHKTNWYAVRSSSRIDGKSKTVLMHRLILDVPKNLVIDHLNGDGLDNRRGNLRICTSRENSRNKKIQKNNTTKYKGVSRFNDKKYQVKIKVDGKLLHLGLFENLLDAARAYDKAASKYYGEFANLNLTFEQGE